MTFYNTINLKGTSLKDAIHAAKGQDKRIEALMKFNGGSLTPFQLHNLYERFYPSCPITSIRRSLTNLTEKGILRKLPKMQRERYGAYNHLWTINK